MSTRCVKKKYTDIPSMVEDIKHMLEQGNLDPHSTKFKIGKKKENGQDVLFIEQQIKTGGLKNMLLEKIGKDDDTVSVVHLKIMEREFEEARVTLSEVLEDKIEIQLTTTEIKI